MDLLLFGDQTDLSYESLNSSLLRTKESPLVNAFLRGAAKTLRREVAHLSRADRTNVPTFTTIRDLVQKSTENVPAHPAIEAALMCISQFIHFICHYEDYSEGYPPANSRILGLCIGSLAAAAVASSRSLSSLLPVAIETVGIAFRVGLVASKTARDLRAGKSDNESWAYVFHGVERLFVDREIEDFIRDAATAKPSSPYLSAFGPNTVTISGSPSLLQCLVEASAPLKKAVSMYLPLYAPYHAAHLYEHVDTLEVVKGEYPGALETVSQYKPWLQLLSTSTGELCKSEIILDLLVHIVHDILKETLRWDLVLEACVSEVAVLQNECVNVLAFGPTKNAKNLVSTLQTECYVQVMLRDYSSWIDTTRSRMIQSAGSFQDSKIAIVGFAGRFPGAADHEKLWEVLKNGLDVYREIPIDRFDVNEHVDPDGKKRNTSHTPYGCFIENPGFFDPRFFNMSPREAAQTDPMQRLALVTAYEALEMAGYVPNRTASSTVDRVGTFYGQTSDDYREVNASQAIDTYYITGGIRAFGPGRIHYHFKFSGPSFSVDTACSSSLAAIQLACTSLWSGDCDTAVAGGLSILTSPDLYAGLSRGQFLSKTGSCKTFDNAADGYCRGDSIGTVILKRLDDAIADKDNIFGVILAAGTNHSADAISITHPHAQTQEHLYHKVLEQAGIRPFDVNVVEMHGTGTQAGDGAEIESISNILAPEVGGRNVDNSLYIGSVKANVGHGEAASGVTALIKALLMFQKCLIPPHVGIKGEINQTFPDLERRNIRIARSSTPFTASKNKKRRLLINNFSAAGGNTALLLEDYVSSEDLIPDARHAHVVVVSAKSRYSLTKNIEHLLSYLDNTLQVSLPSLSYTTTARRLQHDLRIAAIGTNLIEIKESLRSALTEAGAAGPPKFSKIAFAFTGQGAYYVSLGRDLYNTSSHFKSSLRQFDGLSRSHGFPSFLSSFESVPENVQASSPTHIQLLLVCVQMALCSLWASLGIIPTTVIGHSLGEYAALHAASILSASDVIFLVGHRARFLEKICKSGSHGMLAVHAPISAIQTFLKEKTWKLELSCINGPHDIVLSGEIYEIELAQADLVGSGHKCTMLDVPYAFHSSQVDDILEPFEKLSRSVNFHKPTIPIISPLLGTIIEQAHIVNPEYLSKHARNPVHFHLALQNAQQRGLIDGFTGWIEIGPHPVCLGMIRSASKPSLLVATLRRNENAWQTLANSVKELYAHGLNIDWAEYHRDFSRSHQLLSLPSYVFEENNYWIEYNNSWTLTKGEFTTRNLSKTSASFSTTTLQRIVSEEIHEKKASVVFESDFHEASLHAAVTGHLVNDTGLCPSSIYADMALTAARYIYQKLLPSSPEPGMNVRSMEVSKPVIVSLYDTSKPHLLQITAIVDLSTTRVDLEYNSVDVSSRSRICNAHCFVEYGDAVEWSSQWARNAYLIQSRIKVLESEAVSGSVQRILRGTAYKLFSALVHYGDKYRGMEEVLLLSSQREAAAKVKFQDDSKDGNFYLSPYRIDNLAHLSGFALNANDTVDSKSHVFISHGWASMRFAGPFSAEKTYRTYVKMQPEPDSKIMAGDVYIFDENVVVGLIEGLKFQQISRAVLDHLLPPDSKARPMRRQGEAHSQRQSAKSSTTANNDCSAMIYPETVRAFYGVSVADKVRVIIAEEVGVPIQELSAQSRFSELGIDSLLSLAIVGRVREDLDVNLPPTLFADYQTFGELSKHLRQFDATIEPAPDAPNPLFAQAISPEHIPGTTPGLSPSLGSIWGTKASEENSDFRSRDTIRAIIAEEMGFQLDDISLEAPLGSLGMDSLMVLTVLGALREKTGLEVPQTLFADDPSVRDLEERLNTPSQSVVASDISASSSELQMKACGHHPAPSSILLQGSAKGSTRNLFLFPDGSGSATSYASLPALSSTLAVFGLNSPFLTSPREYTCGLDGVAQLYITEIKGRQAKGPYLLGGWSVGGIIAYETAYQLIQGGEAVDKLILIDSPCPLILPPLPVSLVRFFDSLGLFGKGQTPPWLMEHFESSVANLHRYKPRAIEASKSPTTFAIWAREGVCSDPLAVRLDLRAEDSQSASWILDDRNDFGPNFWDQLVGAEKISGAGVPGNHFTMMKEPNVSRLGQQIANTIAQDISKVV